MEEEKVERIEIISRDAILPAHYWIAPLDSLGKTVDPYKPSVRSKGEKARNRKFRGGRP